MKRTKTGLVILIAVAFAAAGCTSGGPSQGDPGTASPPPPSDPAMPAVSNPKNLDAVADPCQLLTSEQLNQLGTGGEPSHRPSPWGQDTCTWDNRVLRVKLSPSTTMDHGLKSALRSVRKEAPDEQVDGYPMVTTQPLSTSCGIYVSATPQDTFVVDVDATESDRPEHRDTCAVAKRVASMVLSNLPAKN
ncbi:DUF3558 domain-containing protein [Saccharopolyspora spinosa]|uniref:DUF3558 domain-containing protein n=1 Tax=Saccharopolyspora spinosa TaxID=60894 RepID=UPI000A031775|nr:DUF3558 domain-containing protein [Saccharopolyspora spinosa]